MAWIPLKAPKTPKYARKGRLFKKSGKRGSNPRPSAWEVVYLSDSKSGGQQDERGNSTSERRQAEALLVWGIQGGERQAQDRQRGQMAGHSSDRDAPKVVPAEEIESEAAEAIRKAIPEGERQERMLDILSRYCAGASYRQIAKEAAYCKSTISGDLHAIQDMIGKQFLRIQGGNVKQAIRNATRVQRKHGSRAVSVRDWHSLRATWVTLALAAGVPVELVRRVTGHATVEVVLEHYFRPDRDQFKAALVGALPDVLTGGDMRKQLSPADELAALAAKVAAGSATKEDKKRLRSLAAKV